MQILITLQAMHRVNIPTTRRISSYLPMVSITHYFYNQEWNNPVCFVEEVSSNVLADPRSALILVLLLGIGEMPLVDFLKVSYAF